MTTDTEPATEADSDLDTELETLARTMVHALESADLDAWAAVFTDDGVSWHSFSGTDMAAKRNAEGLRGLFAAVVADLRYENVRRRRTNDGYVQQHTLYMKAKSGAELRSNVCQVIRVSGGRVVRLEEYMDSSVTKFGQENVIAPAPH